MVLVGSVSAAFTRVSKGVTEKERSGRINRVTRNATCPGLDRCQRAAFEIVNGRWKCNRTHTPSPVSTITGHVCVCLFQFRMNGSPSFVPSPGPIDGTFVDALNAPPTTEEATKTPGKRASLGDGSSKINTSITHHQRRATIPPRPRISLNLWGVLKNCIGKELSRIPLPVSLKPSPYFSLQSVKAFESALIWRMLEKEHTPYHPSCMSHELHTGRGINPLLGFHEHNRSVDYI